MPKTPAQRWWQDESKQAFDNIILNGGKGQLILPTGTGKTRIAIDLMARHHAVKNRFGFYGVVVPRLLLSTQWVQEIAQRFLGTLNKDTNTILGGLDIPVSFIIVSTGTITKDVLDPIRTALYQVIGGPAASAITVTTSAEEIRSQVAMRQRENNTAIVAVSSYHSSARLAAASKILTQDELAETETANIGPLDACFYDECHYLVNGRLEEMSQFESAFEINSTARVFMTATPKTTGENWEYAPGIDNKGMQNTARYGEVIYRRSPRELMEAGAIVGPKAFLIGSEETDDAVADGQEANSKILVCHNVLQHLRQTIQQESSAPEKLGAKLLVVCDGQETLRRIFNNKERFDKFQKANPKLKIYGLSTEFGCYIDGEHHSQVTNTVKDKLLLALKSLQHEDEAIIFHVDMISEGLDVRGITAVLPFKNCGTIKFLQNLGRGTRIHPDDAERIFETGELKPSREGKNYIKPSCYVYLPYLYEGRDDVTEEYEDRIFDMIEEYDFDPSELIELTFSYPAQKPDEFGTAILRQIRDAKRGKEIKNLYIQAIEKENGLNKIRWERRFFRHLNQEQIRMLIRMVPPVVATPNINFR